VAYVGFSSQPGEAVSVPTGDAARQSPAWSVVGGQPTQGFPSVLKSGGHTASRMSLNADSSAKTDRQDRKRELVAPAPV